MFLGDWTSFVLAAEKSFLIPFEKLEVRLILTDIRGPGEGPGKKSILGQRFRETQNNLGKWQMSNELWVTLEASRIASKLFHHCGVQIKFETIFPPFLLFMHFAISYFPPKQLHPLCHFQNIVTTFPISAFRKRGNIFASFFFVVNMARSENAFVLSS